MSANYYLDIGNQLKNLRQEQKKEIKDIATDSRISEKYIEAIEAGDIKAFPSTVYYNLFARAYARELGLDPEKIFVMSSDETVELEKVEALGDEISEQELRGLDVQSDEKEKSIGPAIFWIVGVAVVIIAVVMVFYFTRTADQTTTTEQVEAANNVVVGEMDADTVVPENLGTTSPVPVAEDTASETETTKPQQENKEEAVTPKEPESQRDPMRLRMDIIDSSWVLVIADGDTVLNRSLYAGDFRVLRADDRFILSAYNPNGVDFKLNGIPMRSLSPLGRPVRNVVIDRSNMTGFYQNNQSEESGE